MQNFSKHSGFICIGDARKEKPVGGGRRPGSGISKTETGRRRPERFRYPLFPFDTDSRCQSCQLDLFISGGYDAPDRVPGSRVYLTVLSGTLHKRRQLPPGRAS